MLVDSVAAFQLQVLKLTGAGVGGFDQYEGAGAVVAGEIDKGFYTIIAEIGVDGDGVGKRLGRAGVHSEGGGGVGGGGGADVVAFGVHDDQEPEVFGIANDAPHAGEAARGEGFEIGRLRFDGDRMGGHDVADTAAEGFDSGLWVFRQVGGQEVKARIEPHAKTAIFAPHGGSKAICKVVGHDTRLFSSTGIVVARATVFRPG